MLLNLEETKKKIEAGESLAIAGDEELLKKLPRGKWIGGTIPYFVGQNGGVTTKEKIYVQTLHKEVTGITIKYYDKNVLPNIPVDSPENGFSILIVPANCEAHLKYAQEASDYPGLYLKQIIGWVSGVHLNDLGKISPKVIDGLTGEISTEKIVVLHATLPDSYNASIGIVNIFEQGAGDIITFSNDGFSVKECYVNGKKRNFAEYLVATGAELKYPLVANYSGTMINVSFQNIDEATGTVNLYAPVFANVAYKLACPVADYVKEFNKMVPKDLDGISFSCNCILNYLYSELEGKKTGSLTGPITFGEIAYQLLNQTLVYLQVTSN
jgi:hypothetical protein